MSGAALHRRLDRLAHRYGLSADRLIVVTMHESRRRCSGTSVIGRRP